MLYSNSTLRRAPFLLSSLSAFLLVGCAGNASAPSNNSSPEAVVDSGYGETSKRSFTGAATTLNADEQDGVPYTHVAEMIVARVPGVVIRNQGGEYRIIVRGTNSLQGEQEALLIVDGTPTGPAGLNGISPQDVERITVLKDAGSTAIYGSRGANGVVLIRTKRPR